MSSGLPSAEIICSSTTTLLTFSSVGSSYMVSSRTVSRMERRPRAPVLRARDIVELFQSRQRRQPADELGNRPILYKVYGLDALQKIVGRFRILRALDLGAKADAGLLGAVAHDLLQTVERAAADEQYVGRVDLDEVLVRVLAAALRRHRRDRSLDH